jgi:leader peptidase (prepilin peptidase)/N-methyltransferase
VVEALGAHPLWWAVFSAAVGACMASFCGLLADRLPHAAGWRLEPRQGVNLVTPSHCDRCGTRIGPLCLVPVLGWLFLRGRCAACGARVPWIYPAAEAAAAAASAALALHFGATAAGAMSQVMLWGCMALAWIDWREAWLPARIAAPMLVLGLLVSPFSPDPADRINGLAAAAGAMSAAMLWIRWRHGALVSGGDIMFCAMGGAWLGLRPVGAFLVAAAVLHGAAHAALRLSGRRWEPPEQGMREMMGDGSYAPMGPALALGFLAVLWFVPA